MRSATHALSFRQRFIHFVTRFSFQARRLLNFSWRSAVACHRPRVVRAPSIWQMSTPTPNYRSSLRFGVLPTTLKPRHVGEATISNTISKWAVSTLYPPRLGAPQASQALRGCPQVWTPSAHDVEMATSTRRTLAVASSFYSAVNRSCL